MLKENLHVEVVKVEEPAPGPLKLFDLYSMALGTVIGAGVITMIGYAISYTGYSAWLAYLAAIVFGFLQSSPYMFMSGTFRLSGGTYSIIGHNFSEFWAGIAGITFIPMLLVIGMFGSAFGMYMQSLIPSVSPNIWGVGLIVVFYLINISGIEATSKIQNVMLVVLVISLSSFIIFGIPHIVNPIFDFKGDSFMPNGFWIGFFPAMILLSNSCGGYLTLSPQFGVFSKNATRDIPRAQLLIIPTLILLYVGTGIVASGVLPLDQIAGQPLTLTAQAIFPGKWYLAFILGGPIMCLATTANGTLPAMAQVLVTTADSGWLPKIFAKRNKKGIALAPLTLAAALGIAPIVLGFNPRDIILMVSFSASVLSLPLQLAFFNMPRRHPQAWKNSRMHIPNWIYYILCSFSLSAQAFLLYNSVTQLPLKVILVNFIFAMAVVGWGLYRAYSGKVKVVMSIWPRSADNDDDWEQHKLEGKVQEY
jgi:amino acid transporter